MQQDNYNCQDDSDYEIKEEGCLESYSFSFNSLEKYKTIPLSNKAPFYRTITRGLNLKAVCKNAGCQAQKKVVYIQKGFDKYNIGKEIYTNSCPACKKNVEATNFGYYKTHIKIQGKRSNQRQLFVKQDFVTNNELKTFQQNDEDIREWNYLEVTTWR